MLKEPQPKEQDLIDTKEYRKRRMRFTRKHSQTLQDVINLFIENKTSWGMIVERNAEKFSNNIAIIFEDTKLTYKEFNEWVNRYAHYFISLGLKKGDVIEILMTNRPELMIILSAASKIGAIASLINTDLRDKSLEHCLNLTPGRILIIDEDCLEGFNEVKPNLNLPEDQRLYFLPDKGIIPCPDGFVELSQEVKDFPIHNPSTTNEFKALDHVRRQGVSRFESGAYTKVCEHFKLARNTVFGH